jgi:ABC-type dipeptide/oligopeptide/nickel transport system permease component
MSPRYLLQRLCLIVLVVLVTTLVTFVLLRLVPGDPAELVIQKVFTGTEEYTGGEAEKAIVTERYGMDKPLLVQYGWWLAGMIRFDLGVSYKTNQKVSHELNMRIRPTLYLAALSLAFSLILTLLISTIYSLCSWKPVLRLLDGLIIASIAMPNFYLGILCVLVFSVYFDLLPVSGYGTPAHFVLPVCTLSLTMFGYTATILNDSVADIRKRAYMVTARAKGLSPMALFRGHVLRNAAAPVVPYVALQLGYLLGGVVVIETMFSWPGIGNYLVNAIATKDLPVIQACIALIALAYALANLVADMLLCLIDPRVRF